MSGNTLFLTAYYKNRHGRRWKHEKHRHLCLHARLQWSGSPARMHRQHPRPNVRGLRAAHCRRRFDRRFGGHRPQLHRSAHPPPHLPAPLHRLFPLCHGGYSQFKLDCDGNAGCIRGQVQVPKNNCSQENNCDCYVKDPETQPTYYDYTASPTSLGLLW